MNIDPLRRSVSILSSRSYLWRPWGKRECVCLCVCEWRSPVVCKDSETVISWVTHLLEMPGMLLNHSIFFPFYKTVTIPQTHTHSHFLSRSRSRTHMPSLDSFWSCQPCHCGDGCRSKFDTCCLFFLPSLVVNVTASLLLFYLNCCGLRFENTVSSWKSLMGVWLLNNTCKLNLLNRELDVGTQQLTAKITL